MAATGRFPAGERDKPKLGAVITGSGDGTDAPKAITNTITDAHPMGQTPGSSEPAIANAITKTGENK